MFWKWPISIIGKKLNIGADNRSTPSPNSWQKHHNNPKEIHMTPVHQLTYCEAKNKEITAFESSVQNTAFSIKKII